MRIKQQELSEEIIDMLRKEGNYSEPTFSEYDVELYNRFYHRDIPSGTYKEWNIKFTFSKKKAKITHLPPLLVS